MSISAANQQNFYTYVEGYRGIEACMEPLKAMDIYPNTVVNIAFGSFAPSQGNTVSGLGLSESELKQVIDYVHEKGGKVKIAFGGATYGLGPYLNSPGAKDVATSLANIIKYYGLDGADLDIEDGQTNDGPVVQFVQSLREQVGPDSHLTLTIPAQDYAAKGWITECTKVMNAVMPMEYDFWVKPGSTEADQIESDISLYETSWGIPGSKIVAGIMPGPDDGGKDTSLETAKTIANYAKDTNRDGVMIWDATRDLKGIDGERPMAYTETIQGILFAKPMQERNVELVPSELNEPLVSGSWVNLSNPKDYVQELA